MGTVTPVVVAGEGYVRVEVDWSSHPHPRKCWIHRRVAGVRATLREGEAIKMSNSIAVVFDHEMPYDVPVTYSSLIALNRNGDFEDGVAEWLNTANNGTVGTVVQSKAYYVPEEGIASGELTPNGVSTDAQAVSEFIPATAGTSYTVSGMIMLSDYWNGGVGVRVHWYNGASYISTTGAYNDLGPTPGEFSPYGFSATAPATTTQMRIMWGATGTPPPTLKIYGDEVYVTTAGTTATAADVVVPSDGAGWWVDPLHPATKVKLLVNLRAADCNPASAVGLVGIGTARLPADSDAFAISDARTPRGSWQRRKDRQQSMTVATVTETDQAQVEALHASGAPLLLQLPAGYGEAPAYQLHGDLDIGRLGADMRKPWRAIQSSFSRVLAPPGPPEGTWKARYQDITKYNTFAAATTAGVTWIDALQGELTAP